MKSMSFPHIDSNATDTFKAQKGSKDIGKIIHVTSIVQRTSKTDTEENKLLNTQ